MFNMNNSNKSHLISLISSVRKKHIFIGIIFLTIILCVKLFNSSNPTIPSLHIDMTRHVQNLTTTILLANSTFTSTSTSIITETTTLSLNFTSTTTTTTSSQSTTNIDGILCDNITGLKTENISDHPCERIRCSIILRSSGGRLGNRMFMFASAYGLSRTHNCRLHISDPVLRDLTNNFQMKTIDKNMWLSNEELSHLANIQIKSTVCSFLPELLRPNAFQNIELTGYWQSYLYFDAYREEIREFFSARQDTLKRLTEYFTNITNDICPLCLPLSNTTHQELRQAFRTRYNITWISIHIRRRDFRGIGYASDDDYIHRAITFFRRRHHRDQVRFLVASDDKPYCRDLFASELKSERIIVLPDYFSAVDDLIALSLCHHSIVTGGTYGFWSAYLAGGEVIHDVRYRAVCPPVDYYPSWFMLVGPTVEKKSIISDFFIRK